MRSHPVNRTRGIDIGLRSILHFQSAEPCNVNSSGLDTAPPQTCAGIGGRLEPVPTAAAMAVAFLQHYTQQCYGHKRGPYYPEVLQRSSISEHSAAYISHHG